MNIDKIIADSKNLKPVTSVSEKLLEIIYDPSSSLNDIVNIIKFDQGMTANCLKICNSSYFGFSAPVTSIKQAVAYLGADRVACLVMMGSNAENFKAAQGGYDLSQGELWRYSVSSALLAQDLAEKRQMNNISMIFTAALLKDIGKVILHQYVKESFDAIIREVKDNGLTFIEAEERVIGIDHAELGARIAEGWNFSAAMIDIIKYHHSPQQASPDDLTVPVVYLADSICMMMGIGVGSDGLAYRHHQNVMERLAFSEVDLQLAIAGFWEKLKGVEEMVKLSEGDR